MNNKNEEFVKKENENNELKNIIKQLENKNNILQGEITALKQIIHEKEQLISKFQKYYLDAKTKLIFLLEENKKYLSENNKLKKELENTEIERKVEKKTQIKEMKDKVNHLKNEITRINTYYGTQLIEKNEKIKNLEDNNTKLEGQLIQTMSLNLIGESTLNNQLNNRNINTENNLFNPNPVNQNIFNDYNRTQCFSANKKGNNNMKYKRINNINDFNSYTDKKSNERSYKSNLDSSYYLKLMKNKNRYERNNKGVFNNQTERGKYITEFMTDFREKVFSPQPIEDKKRINDKFQKLISKFE
jgi:regulator of replication initiation timing